MWLWVSRYRIEFHFGYDPKYTVYNKTKKKYPTTDIRIIIDDDVD